VTEKFSCDFKSSEYDSCFVSTQQPNQLYSKSEADYLQLYTDHLQYTHQHLLLNDNFYKNMYQKALFLGEVNSSSIIQSAEIESSNLNELATNHFGWELIKLY
jgi:hypothetical protein